MAAEIVDQQLAVRPAGIRSAERVDLQPHSLDPELAPQARGERNELGIDVGTGKPTASTIDLIELTITACLGRLVAEHRTDAPQLVPLAAQHSVRDDARTIPAVASGRRVRFSPPRFEAVHLLSDDIGELTDGALEERGVLDDGTRISS